MQDSLGDRMKGYEDSYRTKLTKRMPVIIRIDGKAFHTYTRGMEKPFDSKLAGIFQQTAVYLAENIMGCKLVYHQSDEISLLLTNYDKLNTEAWFDNNLQKIVSISASLATYKFNQLATSYGLSDKPALFDARIFVLPKEEVANYFLWRQRDAIRNSVSSVGQSAFNHKELKFLTSQGVKEKLMKDKNINWDELPTMYQRGTCAVKKGFIVNGAQRSMWKLDKEIPLFNDDREYIERFVYLNATNKEGVMTHE